MGFTVLILAIRNCKESGVKPELPRNGKRERTLRYGTG
jgi:hypothetical protein